MERHRVEEWVGRYERAWRTPGTDGLDEVFAADATYLISPWAEPVVGLDALMRFWDDERPPESDEFTMRSSVLAVDGDVAVVRVEVDYAKGERWRDLWVVTLDAAGRCTAFEEWPFAPDTPDGH